LNVWMARRLWLSANGSRTSKAALQRRRG
jgi:hypothetical protein